MFEETWENIFDFPDYMISNYGCVYNRRTNREMSISKTNHGHLKVALVNETGRHTLSVARLVAESFVKAPNPMCDSTIVLNGDMSDIKANNLAWRPQWFAWKYTRQLKTQKLIYYVNLPVQNLYDGKIYSCVVDAGVSEGLLFADIWRSTHSNNQVYPTTNIYRVIQ